MSRIYEELRSYILLGAAITLGVAAFLLSKGKIAEQYNQDPIKGIFSSVLLAMTAFWFFSWIYAEFKELALLDSAFESEKIKRLSGLIFPIAIALSLIFAALIAFSTNILVYSGVLTLLSVSDLYGQITVNRNFLHLFNNRQFRSKAGEQEAQILFFYYIERPMLARIALMLVFFCGAFILAAMAHFVNNAVYRYASYLVIIITIIVNEIVIYSWRRKRDRALAVIEGAPEQKSADS